MASNSQPELPQPNYDLLRLEDHRPAAEKGPSHQAAKLEQLRDAKIEATGLQAPAEGSANASSPAADLAEASIADTKQADSLFSRLAATATPQPSDIGPPAASGMSVMLAGANFDGPRSPSTAEPQALLSDANLADKDTPQEVLPPSGRGSIESPLDVRSSDQTPMKSAAETAAETAAELTEAKVPPAATNASPEITETTETLEQASEAEDITNRPPNAFEADKAVPGTEEATADPTALEEPTTAEEVPTETPETEGASAESPAESTAESPEEPSHVSSETDQPGTHATPANVTQLSVVTADNEDSNATENAEDSNATEPAVTLPIPGAIDTPADNLLDSAADAGQGALENAGDATTDSPQEDAPSAEAADDDVSPEEDESLESAEELPTEGMAFIEELEKKHNQVLEELDALNARIESVLESYLGSRSDGGSDKTDASNSSRAA